MASVAALNLDHISEVIERHRECNLVKERIRRNADRNLPEMSMDHAWNVLVACLLTTQQRSGPSSPVSKLLSESPFPLGLSSCTGNNELIEYAQSVLQERKGVRFTTKIPKQLGENIGLFCGPGTPIMQSHIEYAMAASSIVDERRVANRLSADVVGFGPKQARNFLQILGLSRWVVPLDSRFVKWLKECGYAKEAFPEVLADRKRYESIEDDVAEACEATGVLACVLDAAVFASFDDEEWTPEMAMW